VSGLVGGKRTEITVPYSNRGKANLQQQDGFQNRPVRILQIVLTTVVLTIQSTPSQSSPSLLSSKVLSSKTDNSRILSHSCCSVMNAGNRTSSCSLVPDL
jgi:hypothetical protein